MTKRSQPYSDESLARARRRGFVVVGVLVVLAAGVGAAAVSMLPPLPTGNFDTPQRYFVSRIAGMVADVQRQRETALQRQTDITERATKAQPALKSELAEYAQTQYVSMDGLGKSDPDVGERVGAKDVTLLAIGSPGCENGDSADAYVLYRRTVEREVDGAWVPSWVDLEVARVHLRGSEGAFYPLGGRVSSVDQDYSGSGLSEESRWPAWMQAKARELRRGASAATDNGAAADVVRRDSRSAPRRAPIDGEIDGDVLARQPSLPKELKGFVYANVTTAEMFLDPGEKIDQARLRLKLIGVARNRDGADAYAVVVYRHPAMGDSSEWDDITSVRIQLEGSPGAYRPTRLVGSDSLGSDGSRDFMSWPDWARTAVIQAGQ